MENRGQIYELIGKAIGKIGAIGKERTSKDRSGAEQFKYRGIDQVYNALNPVMAELGIFFCPEVLDQKREERTTRNGALLTYTVLTIRFTAYAPDGSSVNLTVVGEGMDSGDKSSNKAMSVAMKYAMFQLFCIPTEEMKDPDADVFDDVMPRNGAQKPQNAPVPAAVTTVSKLPQARAQAPAQAEKPAQAAPDTPGSYLQRMIAEMKNQYEGFNFVAARKDLIDGGVVPDVPSATMTMDQAVQLIAAVRSVYETPQPKVS